MLAILNVEEFDSVGLVVELLSEDMLAILQRLKDATPDFIIRMLQPRYSIFILDLQSCEAVSA